MHSGTVQLDTELGVGTTFTVMLPAQSQAAPLPVFRPSSNGHSHKPAP